MPIITNTQQPNKAEPKPPVDRLLERANGFYQADQTLPLIDFHLQTPVNSQSGVKAIER
jgi:hypothetical protein